MRPPVRLLALLCVAPVCLSAQTQNQPTQTISNPSISSVSRLPLAFEPNAGEAPADELYLSHSAAMQLGFSSDSIRLHFPSASGNLALSMKLLGGSKDTKPTASERTAGESNYLLGNRPSNWKTHIPQYGRLTYEEVYPGIDLTFYGSGGRVEHDFVVQPGADYQQIKLQYQGARKLAIMPNGDLQVAMNDGELTVHSPHIYQEIAGIRQVRRGRFALLGPDEVAFKVDAFDRTLPLVIDPVLDYSTYLANLSLYVYSAAVDVSGNTYIAGSTFSSSYPVTAGAVQTTCASCPNKTDIFITKLNATGTAQVYSTFLGGSDTDQPYSIAVDSNGNAVVVGYTGSADFPMKNAISAGAPTSNDGFVTSLAPDGASLNFSSRLGGGGSPSTTGGTIASSVTTDSSGNAYVAGNTGSSYLPVTPGALNVMPPTDNDNYVFLTKFAPAGSVVYGAILGATGQASECCGVAGIAIDSAGNAYIAGTVGVTGMAGTTTPWPTTSGAYQSQVAAPQASAPFAAKISADGSTMLYSTLVNTGVTAGMALTANGQVILVGTLSSSPATSNAYSAIVGASYIAELSADGTQLPYYSYFSTPTRDTGAYITKVALDSAGDVWVGGNTNVTQNVPMVLPLQSVPATGAPSAFISEFDPQIHNLLFSTYFNGTLPQSFVSGLAIDSQGRAHVAGTAQYDLPTTSGAYLTSVTPPPQGYTYNYGFAALIDPAAPGPGICFSDFGVALAQVGSSGQASFVITNCGSAPLTISDLQLSSPVFALAANNNCVGTLPAQAACTVYANFTPTAAGNASATVTVTSNATVHTYNEPITGLGTPANVGPQVSFSSNAVAFGSVATGTTSSPTQLTLRNVGGGVLTLSSITASGDFAETNTCGTSLPGGASCFISITFTPTATGARTGTLTVTDNAPASPQTISLTGTGTSSGGGGQTITVTPSSTTLTVSSPGGSATSTIQLAPQGGFTGMVNLTCSVTYQGQGTPTNPPACALNPAQAQITGGSAVSSTLTVSTTAASSASSSVGPYRTSGVAFVAFCVAGLLPFGRRRYRFAFAVLCLLAAGGVFGCGGGGSNSAPSNPGTTPGTYQVVVTANSGSVTVSASLPLTLQ
jgi:hypothetical protein